MGMMNQKSLRSGVHGECALSSKGSMGGYNRRVAKSGQGRSKSAGHKATKVNMSTKMKAKRTY